MISTITLKLQSLNPQHLEIVDDSESHRGHRGNQGGGHYYLTIVSSQFSEKSMIMRHRMVYALLEDLIPQQIHALSIKAYSVEEFSQLPRA